MSELSVFESAKQDYEKELEELRDNFNYEKDLRIKSEKEINRLNNIIDKYEKPLIFLKNRIQQGMSIEEQNKYSIQYVNNILKGDNK